MKNLVLFSGGIDSSTVLSNLLIDGCSKESIACLIVDYGQGHSVEIESATNICDALGISYEIICLRKIQQQGVIFNARNAILISHALSYAVTKSFINLYVGTNKTDKLVFPDCQDEFIYHFTCIADVYGVKLHFPITDMDKNLVIEKLKSNGESLGIDLLGLTWSCYNPITVNGVHHECKECLACKVKYGA